MDEDSEVGTRIEERARSDGTLYNVVVHYVNFAPPYPTMTITEPKKSLAEELDRICSDHGLSWSTDCDGRITVEEAKATGWIPVGERGPIIA